MKEKFDLKLADECAKAFSGGTGLGCIVSDYKGNLIKEYGYGCESCRICQIVGMNKSYCIHAQNYSMAEAERFGGKYIYYCPMGLNCFISPILGETSTAARITAGPFLMVDIEDYIDCELTNFDEKIRKDIIEEIKNIPVLLTSTVNHLSTLLFMSVGFMNKVSVSNRMLETQSSDNIQGQISNYISKLKKEDKDPQYPFEVEKKLVKSILDANKNEAHQLLNELLGYVLVNAGHDLDLIKSRISEILTIIGRTAIDAGADPNLTLCMCDDGRSKILSAYSFEDVCFYLISVTNQLMDKIFKYADVRHSNAIHLCIQYIETHYYEKITLEQLAEMVYFSPAYLSRVFKEETGQTFNSYLCEVRITKAKSLLRYNDLKINDIAAAVGFDDQSYFTKVFRKQVGITPLSYRAKSEKDRAEYK